MEELLHFLATLVAVVLDIVSLAMLARMLLSWFVENEDNRIMIFLACVTEPFILPIRFILSKFDTFKNSPIDLSFFFSYFVITFLRMFLPAI